MGGLAIGSFPGGPVDNWANKYNVESYRKSYRKSVGTCLESGVGQGYFNIIDYMVHQIVDFDHVALSCLLCC